MVLASSSSNLNYKSKLMFKKMGAAASTCDSLESYLQSVSERYLLAKVFRNVNGMNTAAFLDEFYEVCSTWNASKPETSADAVSQPELPCDLALGAPPNSAKNFIKCTTSKPEAKEEQN